MSASTAPKQGLAVRLLVLLGAFLLFAGFVSLGSWQLARRQWKLDLIERVSERVHAPPVEPPSRSRWPQLSAASDEYRHVRLQGQYLTGQSTRVMAVTELGSGFWVLTPLRRADGSLVLVNRGFVAAERAAEPAAEPDTGSAPAVVTGLLRLSEPGGGFLRRNDASADRWYSRDVPAIGAARGLPLTQLAPYFVDADASAVQTPDQPIGGLTVVSFHNSHLVYALTWYGLALMTLWGARLVWREMGRAGLARDVQETDEGR
ncbi:MAG: SURF1 family protein [Pelomonas sp.]|nr:SURF1 family protein [Roseateles sp.]MBV8469635.1 SURF1 family protein [Burkholderiaceae bacterium]MBV8603794.1 SURF1 family protein [Roseateles sp.]